MKPSVGPRPGRTLLVPSRRRTVLSPLALPRPLPSPGNSGQIQHHPDPFHARSATHPGLKRTRSSLLPHTLPPGWPHDGLNRRIDATRPPQHRTPHPPRQTPLRNHRHPPRHPWHHKRPGSLRPPNDHHRLHPPRRIFHQHTDFRSSRPLRPMPLLRRSHRRTARQTM